MKKKTARNNKLNKVVKVMVLSDFFLNAGWGLVYPILAIFIVQSIEGGSALVAGMAVGIYWIGKSIIQIPIAHYLDRHSGEKDDYLALFFGTMIMAIAPVFLIIATLPWHIYVAQAIQALGMALAWPAWSAIFTRHIASKREAFCWSLDSSLIGIGAGLAGILGGLLVQYFGFIPLFFARMVLTFIAAFMFLLIIADIVPRDKADRIFLFPKL